MAVDPRKRQKKLQRRAARQKAKHRALVREKSKGFAAQLATAAGCPILHSSITPTTWTDGLGWVCLSRELPNGSVALALFLVDRYCLGVKNIMAQIVSQFDYESSTVKQMREREAESVPPSTARKLVEQAVEYARKLGFQPHPDYAKARHIFGDIDAGECKEEFEFGKDGKPLFITGPHDTPGRCQQIRNTLERSCGPGGYHYVMSIPGDTMVRPEMFARDENEGDGDGEWENEDGDVDERW
jgi:hypothetical protein